MIFIGLLLTTYFGYCLLEMVNLKVDRLLKLPLSYLIGIGVQTLVMFYMAVAEVKLNTVNVFEIILTISVVVTIGTLYFKKSFLPIKFITLFQKLVQGKLRLFIGFTLPEKLLVIIITAVFIFVLIDGAYMPITGWDSMALYDFRAKVFFITGYMKDAIDRGYFFGYPLMTTMMNTWVYLLGGQYPRFMYSFIYISFSLIFYSLSRHSTSRLKALIFTLLLMVSPQIFGHASFDYSNMPYTAYFFVSSAFLYLWTKNKQIAFLIVSAVLMGLATWIRSTDPFWTVNIVTLIIWAVVNKKPLPLILYLFLFLPIQQSWNIFVSSYSQIVSTQVIASSAFSVLLQGLDVGRLFDVVKFVIQNIGLKLALYIILSVLATLAAGNTIKRHAYLLLVVSGNVGLLVLGSYIFSFIWPGWGLIGESLQRMSFVFVPLLLYYALVLTSVDKTLSK